METKKIDYNRLKEAIREKGMSLSQASAGMGYSVKSLQQAGMRGMISAPMLHALGATYGITYEDIGTEEGVRASEAAERAAEAAEELDKAIHEVHVLMDNMQKLVDNNLMGLNVVLQHLGAIIHE